MSAQLTLKPNEMTEIIFDSVGRSLNPNSKELKRRVKVTGIRLKLNRLEIQNHNYHKVII